TTKSPVYVCRFLRSGKEVHRVRYDGLPHWDWPGKGWEEVPKVKRTWNWSAMIPNEIKYKAEDTEESYYSRLRLFFHHDGEELPTREVRVACRNATRLLFKLDEARANKREAVEEIAFPVIRRTITIQPQREGR